MRLVFVNRLGHRQAIEFRAQIDRRTLIRNGGLADDLLRNLANQRFGEIHQVVIILIGLVELEHREFRVVPRREALVAKVAVDLEHFLHPADHELLEIELRGDAQIELHVERVVMRDEWPRRCSARNRVHHRRLDFEIAAGDEELAHRLHDLRALDEDVERGWIGDQIDVALSIALFLVGEPVELFRQRPQRLREQPHLARLDRQLASLGLEQRAPCADEVAQVPVLEGIERLGAECVERDVELDAAAHVLQRREGGLAHHALQHHSSRDCHGCMQRFELLVALAVEFAVQLRRERIAPEVVRVGVTKRAQRCELRQALSMGHLLWIGVVLLGHGYTPCFKLAAMKSSRSPSRIACVLPTS